MSDWSYVHKIVVNNLNECDTLKHLEYINESNVNVTSASGTTPLHLATLASKEDLVSYLISVRAAVNASNEFGETPLHWACKHGNLEIVKLLLDHGAVAGSYDHDGNSPLHWAAEYNHTALVHLLLHEDPTLLFTKNDSGDTPLRIACDNENYETAKIFLQAGAPADDVLTDVVKDDNMELVQILKKHAVEHNDGKVSPNFPTSVKLMTKKKVDAVQKQELVLIS